MHEFNGGYLAWLYIPLFLYYCVIFFHEEIEKMFKIILISLFLVFKEK